MGFSKINISLDELKELNINLVIPSGTTINSFELENIFNECKNSDALIVIKGICSMLLMPNNTKNPYKPRFEFDNHRGVVPSDFSEYTLRSLKDFYYEIKNSLLKARIADLLWITKVGGIEFAISAIDNFSKTAFGLINTGVKIDVIDGFKFLERSLRMAASLRKNNVVEQKIYEILNIVHDDINLSKFSNVQTIKLIEILINVIPQGIEQDLIKQKLMVIAEAANSEKDYFLAERAHRCILNFTYFNKDKNGEYESIRNISNCFVNQAKLRNEGFVSAGFIRKAIECLRNIPDTRLERDQLYELMRDYQVEGLSSFNYYSVASDDLSELKKFAVENVKGKDLFDTIMRFSICINSVDELEKLNLNAKKAMSEQGLLTNIFNTKHFDQEALPVAEIDANKDSEKEWEYLIQSLKISHQMSVVGYILPALEYIVESYHLDEGYFYDLLRNNPIIPDGHVEYFSKGIFSGFIGDYVTASHLIIPQIENSLRYLLSCLGEQSTQLHSDQTQERLGLKQLLEHKNIEKVLTENITKTLKIILLDKIYGDHRNQVTHGYMYSSYYKSYSSIYIWWFVLHILMMQNYKLWQEKYYNK